MVLFPMAMMMMLLMMMGGTSATNTVLTLNAGYGSTFYTSGCSQYTYFQVDFPYPCHDLLIELMVASGQPEIYVSKVLTNPTKRDLTWSVVDGTSITISHWDPETSPGTYYIGVYDNCISQSNPASFQIRTSNTTSEEDLNGIYLHPQAGKNQLVKEEGYMYYKFCIDKCADVRVDLFNCMVDAECPKAYSYPELLVSRTVEYPTIYDYSYKLASVTRRHVTVFKNDSAGRDHNGFITGTYYVGVYGWCTPDNYVYNWTTDGPCSYASRTLFNLTVTLLNEGK